MTGKAIVPAKAIDPLPATMARTDELLRLWTTDLETIPREELRALCLAAATALQSAQPAALAAQIVAPVTGRQMVLELDDLIAAFPGMRKDADLTTFSRLLGEEVRALNPSAAALRAACRGLIRTATFPPGIGDVVAAVATQKAEWASRAALLERLPRRLVEAVEALGDAREPG